MSIKMRLQSIIIEKKPASSIGINWSSFIKLPEVVELIAKEQHPDKLLITPTEGKYSVTDVDRIIEWQKLRPFSAEFKVTIIEQADLLNVESQNRLLKTLEEPSENSQIVLITANQHKLLDTVLSRCLSYNLAGELEQIHELGQSFLAGNLIQKMEVAEQIAGESSGTEIVGQILAKVFSQLQTDTTRLSYQDLLNIYINYRKNKYNLRLTLECLAIMLE